MCTISTSSKFKTLTNSNWGQLPLPFPFTLFTLFIFQKFAIFPYYPLSTRGGKQGWWTLEPPMATLLRDAPMIPSPVLTLCPIRFGGLSSILTSYRWLLWQVHSALQCIAQHCTAFNPNPFSKANCTPSRSHFKTFFAPFPFTKLLPFAPNTHHSILLFEPFPTNITSKGSVEVAIAWCTACLDFHFRSSPPFSPNLPLPSATTLHPHIAKSWEVSNLIDKLKVRW